MRVRMLVVAMIATPLLASVSYAQSSNANDHANMRFKVCEKLSPAKNKQGSSNAGNSSNVRRQPRKCVPDVPPPVTPPSGGIAEIHGMAFTDANGNGIFDSGEAPLAGWVIQLSGTASAMTTTAADGSYEFTNLPVGTYTVCAASGMTQSAPTSGPACPGGAFGWSAEVPDVLPNIWYMDIDFALH
jgi:hypothetical protein